jgi:hypothetical protein
MPLDHAMHSDAKLPTDAQRRQLCEMMSGAFIEMRLLGWGGKAEQVAELAAQVREQRHPVSPDNPMLQWQAKMSEQIVAALNGYRDLRDSSMEKIFLGLYGSPVLQAMVGLGDSEEPPRKGPGIDPARAALVQRRIAELKASVAKGGARETAIRALVYIGMGGAGVDERAFNELRQIRAEHQGLTLQEFKQVLREQYFILMLDRDGALAALPDMLPASAAARQHVLELIRRTVHAAGKVTGEKALRLARIEALFTGAKPVRRAAKPVKQPARKTARPATAARKRASSRT